MFDPLHKWLGIPNSEQPPNDYRLLGVPLYEDDPEVIDAAADKHLAFLHDMSNGEYGEHAEQLSNQVSSARLRLLNKEKKAAYDELLRAELAPPQPPAPPSTADVGFAPTPEPAPEASGFAPGVPVSESPGSTPVSSEPVTGTPVSGSEVPGSPIPGTPPSGAPLTAVPYGGPEQQQQPLTAVPVSQAPPPPPNADVDGPEIRNRRLPNFVGRGARNKGRTWFYMTVPGAIILILLISLIALGRLRLDRNKMESIGVPSGQAAWIAGEPEKSDAPDEPVQLQVEPPTSAPSTSDVATSTESSIPTRVQREPDGMAPDPTDIAANVTVPFVPNSPPPSVSPDTPSLRPDSAAQMPVLPTKNPLPSKSDVDAKMKVVRELYQQPYKAAKTREAKLSVAQQMLSDADEQAITDPVGQYALMRVARDIYIGEGDFQSSLEIADRLASGFADVDAVELKSEAIRSVKSVFASQVTPYANAAFDVASGYMDRGEFLKSKSICVTMRRLLRARIPGDIAADLKILEEDIDDAKRLFDAYEESALVLESNPNDPDAQTVAGKFLCLVEDRWEDGLARLARGSDENLKIAAAAELGETDPSNADLVIADAWYDASEQATGPLEKRKLIQRATEWYESAQPKSQGLELIKINRRLQALTRTEIDSNDPGNSGSNATTARPRRRTRAPRLLDSKTWTDPQYSTNFANINPRGPVITVGMGDGTLGRGEACAGLEISGAVTIIVAGTSSAQPTRLTSSSKTGFMIDYQTTAGRYKRVFLRCGSGFTSTYTNNPPWGSAGVPDQTDHLGEKTKYTIDLKRWAPSDWNGTIWFAVYMQNAGVDRTLNATVGWIGPGN